MLIKPRRSIKISTLLLLILFTSACGASLPSPTAVPVVTTPSPAPAQATSTPAPPTPTPLPLAARVNGEGITLQEYQEELTRFQNASEKIGTNMATGEEQLVLEDIVNQVLLAQAAAAAGFQVDQAMLEERLEQLSLEIGGRQILENWITENGYTPESLAHFFARSLASAWMRDTIINSVPLAADQIHVRQILLNDADTAQEVLDRLASGREFGDLAGQYDPLTGGDLGWFPSGYLAEAALDEAVFGLEPGETSPVIETDLGFHILQVIEVAVQRPLSPDARLVLQERALQVWLEEHRNKSDIQFLLP
jgi:peptidyl-prolyl cis-trans isomerase C